MANTIFVTHGNNLGVLQMRLRCPAAVAVGTVILKGCRLLFQDSAAGARLTIEQQKNSQAPIAVWLVPEEESRRLDCRRITVEMQTAGAEGGAERTSELSFCFFPDTVQKPDAGQQMQILLDTFLSREDV